MVFTYSPGTIFCCLCCALALFPVLVYFATSAIIYFFVNDGVSTPHEFHLEVAWDDSEFQHMATWVGYGVLSVYAMIILCWWWFACCSCRNKRMIHVDNSYYNGWTPLTNRA